MEKARLDLESMSLPLGWVGKSPKILVIQQKMIGDVLVSSLICENLKRSYPNSEVHYLINRFTIPVIENNPYIDEVIIFEDLYKSNKIEFFKFLRKIRKTNYDIVVDAYGKLESNLITFFSKAKFTYSYTKWYTKCLYLNTVEISGTSLTEAGLAIENRQRLFQLLPDVKVFNVKPKIYLTPVEVNTAHQQINFARSEGNLNLIMVSALGSGETKTYPLVYMADLLNEITAQTNAHFILNYMTSQQAEINRLLSFCNESTKERILLDLTPKSLREFMAVCSLCNLIFGNEGGAINMAKAIDVPSFAIFSPWIIKEGWNSFEYSYPNASAHLIDFKPKLVTNSNVKDIKANYKVFYKSLEPMMFKTRLIDFVLSHLD
jgi:heptosyltransferase-2